MYGELCQANTGVGSSGRATRLCPPSESPREEPLTWFQMHSYLILSEGPQVPTVPVDDIRVTNLQFADPVSAGWVPVTQFQYDVFGPNVWGCFDYSMYRFRYPGTPVGLPANSWLAKTSWGLKW